MKLLSKLYLIYTSTILLGALVVLTAVKLTNTNPLAPTAPTTQFAQEIPQTTTTVADTFNDAQKTQDLWTIDPVNLATQINGQMQLTTGVDPPAGGSSTSTATMRLNQPLKGDFDIEVLINAVTPGSHQKVTFELLFDNAQIPGFPFTLVKTPTQTMINTTPIATSSGIAMRLQRIGSIYKTFMNDGTGYRNLIAINLDPKDGYVSMRFYPADTRNSDEQPATTTLDQITIYGNISNTSPTPSPSPSPSPTPSPTAAPTPTPLVYYLQATAPPTPSPIIIYRDREASLSADITAASLESTLSARTTYNVPPTTHSPSPIPFETDKPVKSSFPWGWVIGGAGLLFLFIFSILSINRQPSTISMKTGQLKTSDQPPTTDNRQPIPEHSPIEQGSQGPGKPISPIDTVKET